MKPLSTDQVAAFWEQGYLLVKGALDAAATARARQAILDMIPRDLTIPDHYHVSGGRIKPFNPDGNHSFYTAELAPLLTNERLYRIAAQLLESDYLLCGDGSVGVTMRDMSGEIRSQRLHVDMRRPEQVDEASLRYRVGIGGCYYLSDVEPQGAGIHVVPGGSRLVAEKMLAAPPEQALELYDGWKHLDDFPQTIEVTGKAGDFVLMHHLMPHCASRNRRATPRVVQFARFFRVEGEALHRAAHDDTRFSQSFLTALSPLGRKLIGIEPWLPKSES